MYEMRFKRAGVVARRGRVLVLAAALLAGTTLSACDKKAEGQVAAVVNGEEVTLQEINAELAGAQIPEGADRKALQKAALQRIVERRLLAQAAREDGLDETPEYLVRRRTLDDNLLIQLLAQRAGKTIRVPEGAAVDKFMAENPDAFSNRGVLQVAQIQFPTPSDPARLKQLEPAKTLDEVAAILQRQGVQFRRNNTQVDTASVPPALMKQIEALPAGEPFVLPTGGVTSVNVITGRTAAPLAGPEARPMAVNAMRNRELTGALQRRLESARGAAEIEYQPGFEPPAGAAKGGSAAGASATKAGGSTT